MSVYRKPESQHSISGHLYGNNTSCLYTLTCFPCDFSFSPLSDYIYKVKLYHNGGVRASIVFRKMFENDHREVQTNMSKCVLINDKFQRLKFQRNVMGKRDIYFTPEEATAIKTHMVNCSSKTAACSLNCTDGFFKVPKDMYLDSKAFVLRPIQLNALSPQIGKECSYIYLLNLSSTASY